MLDLNISCKPSKVGSGGKIDITAKVRSTRDSDVTVTLHFPAAEASLTPHRLSIPVAPKGGPGLARGTGTLASTITASPPGWYTLTGRASDGHSEAEAVTLVRVT
ncbi:MAG: hypothetical protein ACYC8T_00820 [Myxococcaceae bacterium]